MAKLKLEVETIRTATILGAAVSGTPFLPGFPRASDLDSSQLQLKQMQKQFKMELEKLEVEMFI
jgi:hypothetical protein